MEYIRRISTAPPPHLKGVFSPLRHPSDQDLEDWLGWNPDLMRSLTELKEEADDNKVCMEKMSTMITMVLKKLKGLEAAEALRTGKVMNTGRESKEDTGKEDKKVAEK